MLHFYAVRSQNHSRSRNPLATPTKPCAALEIATHSSKNPRAYMSAGFRAPPGPSSHKHDTRPARLISLCCPSAAASTSILTSNEAQARAQSASKWIPFAEWGPQRSLKGCPRRGCAIRTGTILLARPRMVAIDGSRVGGMDQAHVIRPGCTLHALRPRSRL